MHELLRGTCGNVEDLQDMRREIPRWHFGFACSQQSTELYRFVEGACVSFGPQRVDACLDLWDHRHVLFLRMIWIPAIPCKAHHTPVVPDGEASCGC